MRDHFEDMVPKPRCKHTNRMESFKPVADNDAAFCGPDALVSGCFWVVGNDYDDGFTCLATAIGLEAPCREFNT